jgi:hypothetical protein
MPDEYGRTGTFASREIPALRDAASHFSAPIFLTTFYLARFKSEKWGQKDEKRNRFHRRHSNLSPPKSSDSRFDKCFNAKTIKTFAGGKGFGGETAVQGGFNAQHKFAAELFCGQRLGQLMTFRFQNFNPFLDDPAKSSVHPCLVSAVAALADQRRRAAHKTAVLVAPLHDFHVAGGFGL